MKLSAILAPMIAAGVSGDVILATVKAFEDQQADIDAAREEEADASKEKTRERWRRWKANQTQANVGKRLQPLANGSRGAARVEDNLQTKNQDGKEGREEDAPVARSVFPDFWTLYPNKVGKREAEAAFLKAVKRADLATILAGVRRYAAKTDDRPWCNPATWLNQDRWDDAPASVPARSATSPPAVPRNAGERAFLKLQSEREHEPSDTTPRRLETGNGRRQAEGDVHAFAAPFPRSAFGGS